MKIVRSLMAIVALLALFACLLTVEASAQKKKKRGKGAVGKVISIEEDSIKIKTRKSKKKMTEAKELSFKLTTATKFAKRKGKKQFVEISREDIKVGSFVFVVASKNDPETAQRVTLFTKRKKKKQKDN